MPPKPLFKSSRVQTVAVAVLMALFLLGATGLAKLQMGDGPASPNTPIDRKHEMSPPEAVDQQYAIVIETPAHWQTVQSEPGRFMAVDPDKPGRRITLIAGSASGTALPAVTVQRFLERQLDAAALETFQPVTEPMGFKLDDTGLIGVQFIGNSNAGEGKTQQHLIACLMYGGRYWWVYLTDTVDADGDEHEAMRANVWLLQSVYRSAKIVQE